jgi:ethanolamine utilization microcompartment shell protein EutS
MLRLIDCFITALILSGKILLMRRRGQCDENEGDFMIGRHLANGSLAYAGGTGEHPPFLQFAKPKNTDKIRAMIRPEIHTVWVLVKHWLDAGLFFLVNLVFGKLGIDHSIPHGENPDRILAPFLQSARPEEHSIDTSGTLHSFIANRLQQIRRRLLIKLIVAAIGAVLCGLALGGSTLLLHVTWVRVAMGVVSSVGFIDCFLTAVNLHGRIHAVNEAMTSIRRS